jgi:hypothetical protein
MRSSTKLSLIAAAAGLLAAPALAAEPASLEEVMAGLDQTGTPPPPADAPAPSAPPLADKRAVPDYDGRPEATPGAAATLLWVPRVVLYPVHAVAEYGVRRPLVGAVTWSEEHYALPRLRRVFTSEDGKRGLYPYFVIDTGLRPRFGVVGFADSLGHPNNDLRLTGNFARADVYSLSAQNRTRFSATSLVVRAGYGKADDSRFYGLGPATDDQEAAFFALRRLDASVALERELGGLSHAALFVRARDAHFGASGRGRDVAGTHGGEGQPPLPEGWDGYQLLTAGGRAVLDSRSTSAAQMGGTGARVELDASYSARDGGGGFGEWGGEVGGFYDVSGHENVIGVRLAARFQEGRAPFAERISLGGGETMRGFDTGRFRGDSAVLAEVQYRYAIWMFADAELFSGVGNTFDGHLRDFRPDALFWTSGVSLRTTFSRDSSWAAGVAMGSRRLDSDHFAVADHVRFFAGLNKGF